MKGPFVSVILQGIFICFSIYFHYLVVWYDDGYFLYAAFFFFLCIILLLTQIVDLYFRKAKPAYFLITMGFIGLRFLIDSGIDQTYQAYIRQYEFSIFQDNNGMCTTSIVLKTDKTFYAEIGLWLGKRNVYGTYFFKRDTLYLNKTYDPYLDIAHTYVTDTCENMIWLRPITGSKNHEDLTLNSH